MRWEYQAPERDIFLVDGKTAWFYVPGDHTVVRVPAKQSTDWRTPLALLAGEMKVSRVCARVELAQQTPETPANVVLQCRLRGADPDGSSKRVNGDESGDLRGNETVFFEIDQQTGELARLEMRQAGGVNVEFRFKGWRMNPALDESMFRFNVPLGTAIVNGVP